jgi:hypothetical protein
MDFDTTPQPQLFRGVKIDTLQIDRRKQGAFFQGRAEVCGKSVQAFTRTV